MWHDLRHTHVALLIAGGAHPKSVQARLGHASVTTTLNTYGHLLPSLEEQLTEGLESAYRESNGDQMGPNEEPGVIEFRQRSEARPSPRGDRVHGGDTPLAVIGERRARVVTVDLAGEPVAVEDRFRDHPRGQTVANPVHAFDAGRV